MVAQNIWLSLSRDTRVEIAKRMNMPRSTGVTVDGGRVICDGHTPQDLMEITVEKLQKELQVFDTTDFYALFNQLVDLIEGKISAVPEVAQPAEEKIEGGLEILEEIKEKKKKKTK